MRLFSFESVDKTWHTKELSTVPASKSRLTSVNAFATVATCAHGVHKVLRRRRGTAFGSTGGTVPKLSCSVSLALAGRSGQEMRWLRRES